MSTPSGWFPIVNTFTGNLGYSIFYQIYSGAAAPTITGAGGGYYSAMIMRITDVNSPYIGTIGTVTTGSSTTITSQSINTAYNNALVFSILLTANGIAPDYSTPTGWTANFDLADTTIGWEFASVSKQIAGSGGASGSTSSGDPNISQGWMTIQFEVT